MKKGVWIAIVVILVIIIGSWLLFKTKSCDTESCFEEAARECSEADISLEDEQGGVTYYKIMEKEGDNCRMYIKVEELSGVSGENARLLKNADMICDIPRNELSKMSMGEMIDNLDYCHGLLKEAIYEITLKQLYGLVTRDMGNVLKEIKGVI